MKLFLILLIIFNTGSLAVAKDEYYAFVPYVNYDSTQLWSLGTAFEKATEHKNIDTYLLDVEISPLGNTHLETSYKTAVKDKWATLIKANFTNFNDSFYGFGINTTTENQKKLKQRVINSKVLFLYQNTPKIFYGPFIGLNQRIEIPKYQIDGHRYFNDETSLAIGVNLHYDSRDSKINPHTGKLEELTISLIPDNPSTFSQLKLDLREYFDIEKTVLATRFSAGGTIGTPSYLYNYRLGGFNYLRGYQTNRFMGPNFAITQLEERVNIFKERLIATAAVEAGTVNTYHIKTIQTCYDIGLRIAMPPDWVSLLSVNLGFGKDQDNFTMEFNENF